MNVDTTQLNHHALLETIITITEQRDQHSLAISLCASLREMLQPRHCMIVVLPSGGDASIEVSSNDEEVVLPECVLSVAREMSEDEIRQAVIADVSYRLAVMEPGESRRVLMVGREIWHDGSERIFLGMLRVYQNFVKLLSDSEKDTLTGLYNRRKLDSHLASRLTARLHERRRRDKSLSDTDEWKTGDYLAVLDLDKFKQINDTYGHLIGDEVLLLFADILRACLREGDHSFRYGGEEFILILSDISSEQARKVLDRLRFIVEQHRFPQVGQITVSIGYTLIDRQHLPNRVIEEADKALYYAKAHGRNQVRDYSALRAEGAVEDAHHDGSVELF